MIEVQSLKKSFGAKRAVEDVSFRAPDRCITGVLGPNGAGKTTVLRMICGLIRPDAGKADIDGTDPAVAPAQARRALGALPDTHGLYARLTAREHLQYFGRLQGLEEPELEQSVQRLLQLFDMKDIADRRTGGFSQGERRKVALARALVHGPQNLLLDEPTSGLDVMSARSMRRFVKQLAEEGRCVVFSSHQLEEVSALCDRVVILAHGRVAAEGTPAELLRRTGKPGLEEAFVELIGSREGLE